MSYRNVAQRLSDLEATENARIRRMQHRVLDRLSNVDVVVFGGFVERWEADPEAIPTPEEWEVLGQVDTFLRVDPEVRPSDYLVLDREGTL